MRGDLSKNNGEKTKPSNAIKNDVKKDLVYGLLRTLYEKYPNYVSYSELIDYKNILSNFSGITIPSIHRNSENSHKPEFLAEAALVQLTNYIEKLDNSENYRITIKGIELLNAINLETSSRRLENLSKSLLTLTGLLAVFTLTSILSTLYINYKIHITYESLASALRNFIPFFIISAIVVLLSFIVAYIIIGYIHHNKKRRK
ncbi:MAG: hypothetical protein M1448_02805 [Candidatus Marsarchaeota archaeon]|nr:hypothetical protein [Candidatus Marsarchaeota archaeon]